MTGRIIKIEEKAVERDVLILVGLAILIGIVVGIFIGVALATHFI